MDKKKRSLTLLKDILADLFEGGEIPFRPEDGEIWNVWKEVVGASVAENARPLWIKDGLLRVSVSSPIWLQELQYRQEEIKIRLNQKLGRRAVRKIEFRLK